MAMIFYYYVNNNLYKAKSINIKLDLFVINYIYEPINDDKD